MSSVTGFVASYLINSVWEITLIGGAGWLVSRLLNRIGPQAEHVAWVSTLMLAIVTPAFPVFRWLMAGLFVPRGATGHASIALVAAQGGGTGFGGVHVLPMVVVLPLLSLYVGLLLYFAVRFGWSLRCTRMLLRRSCPLLLTPEQEEIWQRCRESFSIERARILRSSWISGPVTVGLREPVLLVPREFAEECSSEDFFAALAHESAHMRRRDFNKNLFYEAASLVVAFHPVTWMLKSQIAQTREMICDGMATDGLIDSSNYTQSLLRLATMVALASRASPSHAIGIFDANILEKRIMMMNVKKKHLSSALRYGVMAPAMLFLLTASMGGAAMAVVVQPPSTAPSAAQTQPYGTIYHVGKDISAPVLMFSVEPEFPASARNKKDKFEGACLIGLVVDSSGVVHNVHVKRSLRADFDEQAVEAVKQYRFKPATRAGEPVSTALTVEVNFRRF